MDQISIRHAEIEDAEALFELHSHQSVYENTLQLPYPAKEVWRNRLANTNDLTTHLVAVINQQVAGILTIHQNASVRRKHSATFGISIHPNHQRKRIGKMLMNAMIDYCDNWLNIRRIELEVYSDNESGIALYHKFGFNKEGEAKDYAFRNGKYVDAIFMSRIKDTDIQTQ